MTEDGFIEVLWIDGPYDGASHPLPDMYEPGAIVAMPDPATVVNADAPDAVTVYAGATHLYKLEAAAPTGFVARYVTT